MNKYRARIKFIFSCMFIFFFLIFYKLIMLQIGQRMEPPLVHKTLEPKRGRIMDRNLQDMAIMIDADSLYCTKGMPDPFRTGKQLARILNDDFNQIYKKLRTNRDFMWVSRKITYSQSKAIEELNNPYLGFLKESKRIYPNGELASHIIGFSGIDNNGLDGIEFAYDSLLCGKPGLLVTEKDAWGRVIVSKSQNLSQEVNGADIVLTIDKVIQHIAEQELKEVSAEYGVGGGSIIVMEPYTGEVLAMANVPLFEPNSYAKYSSESRRNRAVTDTFEPGSTMKIFTAVAALEEGVVSRNEVLNCDKGSLVVGNHVVHDSKDHGKLTFKEVLGVSSNIGVVRVAMRLGKERVYNYFSKFGFGKKTDIDLRGEVDGKLLAPERWSGTSITAIPTGQEIGVTCIQLAKAISSVANGGYEIKPYIIKEIRNSKGIVIKQNIPHIGSRIISDKTIREMHNILEGVVETGTGRRSKTEDYTIAAKTGTAQKFVRGRGGYASGDTVLSFVGYAPVTKPRLAIVVILESRDNLGWAEGILGPVFKSVAQRSLHYMNVIPDKVAQDNKAASDVKTAAKEENVNKVSMAYNYTGKTMPLVVGMSVRKAMDILSCIDMEIKIVGSGIAVKQVPSAGAEINTGGTCIIYFAKK